MDFLRTCRARRFCACTSCLSFMFDAEGGSHRGAPLALTAERARATSGYAPTHREGA